MVLLIVSYLGITFRASIAGGVCTSICNSRRHGTFMIRGDLFTVDSDGGPFYYNNHQEGQEVGYCRISVRELAMREMPPLLDGFINIDIMEEPKVLRTETSMRVVIGNHLYVLSQDEIRRHDEFIEKHTESCGTEGFEYNDYPGGFSSWYSLVVRCKTCGKDEVICGDEF